MSGNQKAPDGHVFLLLFTLSACSIGPPFTSAVPIEDAVSLGDADLMTSWISDADVSNVGDGNAALPKEADGSRQKTIDAASLPDADANDTDADDPAPPPDAGADCRCIPFYKSALRVSR